MTLQITIPSPSETAPGTKQIKSATPTRTEEARRFAEDFEKHAPSSRKPIKHENVGALLLSFDKDFLKSSSGDERTLDVKDEVKALEDVLRDEYQFDVSNEVIEPEYRSDAHGRAMQHLSNFRMKHTNKKHSLLIVYYGGHGWRSNEWDRKQKLGFNLTSERAQRAVKPRDGTYIIWETAEKTLDGIKSDILVILDCCDAGYLSKRGAGYAFEYLVACPEGGYTHKPGQNSFTSALTWALKEMKSQAPFTTTELKDMIKRRSEFPNSFPPEQEPKVFPRLSQFVEPVWISPLRTNDGDDQRLLERNSSNAPEFRSEDCSFIDLRFHFNREITAEDAMHVAALVGPAVHDRGMEFNARHVSLLNRGKLMKNNWRKARKAVLWGDNTIKFMKRPQRQVSDEAESPPTANGTSQLPFSGIEKDDAQIPEMNKAIIEPLGTSGHGDAKLSIQLRPGSVISVGDGVSANRTSRNTSDGGRDRREARAWRYTNKLLYAVLFLLLGILIRQPLTVPNIFYIHRASFGIPSAPSVGPGSDHEL